MKVVNILLKTRMPKRLLVTLLTLIILIAGTVVAIRYAQGYRFSRQAVMKSTGLLSANSFPNGASVYLNGTLTSATDTTINLPPGEYEIEIKKEGYFPWKKSLKLETELVAQTNALLFPTAPGLTPLTFIGAQNLHPSPDGQRILFTTASASGTRNGIYVMDLTDNPLALQKGPHQIARSTSPIDWNKALFLWSPDSDQVLVNSGTHTYLLDAGRLTDLDSAKDVSSTLTETLTSWKQLLEKKILTQRAKFPLEIQRVASESAVQAFVSPDQERILYTASEDVTLPDHLLPPVPASNSQPQERSIHAGNTYVYDRREDRNFVVKAAAPTPTPTPSPTAKTTKKVIKIVKPVSTSVSTPVVPLSPDLATTIAAFQKEYSGLYVNSPQWLPDSKHLIFLGEASIRVSEYDGTNMTQVYAGPLANNFVYPWPNGTKLLILTNFNQSGEVPLNLYAVSLR